MDIVLSALDLCGRIGSTPGSGVWFGVNTLEDLLHNH